ncbi:ABC transporter permease [Nakamurella lactea]|uniref:ABC transporter permease n=1 Tax=Nakamurella lactea TaxID=459515 RepID=UPI0004296557|nr:ABC transporter permease [Nakamurella lactea]
MAQQTASTAVEQSPSERPQRSPWLGFLLRRTVRLVVSLFALITFAFLIIHLVPGDPVRKALGLNASPELVSSIRAELGFDLPLWQQYLKYLGDLFSGNLGVSLASRLPVGETIGNLLPNTLLLAVIAFVVVMVIAVPLGMLMAVLTQNGRRRGVELSFTTVSIVVSAIPEFLLAVGLVYLFAVTNPWFPIAGMDGPASFVLPVAALALGPIAAMSRIVRVEALAVLGLDFIRTARAKRLPAWRIYLRHALPNALTATLTLSGLLLSGLVAGTVLVETIFAWPGLGPSLVSSILDNDYPLVQAIVLVYGGLVLLINFVVDILLGLADPRSTIKET